MYYYSDEHNRGYGGSRDHQRLLFSKADLLPGQSAHCSGYQPVVRGLPGAPDQKGIQHCIQTDRHRQTHTHTRIFEWLLCPAIHFNFCYFIIHVLLHKHYGTSNHVTVDPLSYLSFQQIPKDRQIKGCHV